MIIQRICPVCDVVYSADVKRLKHGRQTTCSRQCSYKMRANNLENSKVVICATCGIEFKRSVSQIKSDVVFCSTKCHYKARSNGTLKRIITKPYNVSDAGRKAWAIGAQKTRKIRLMRNNYKHSDETKKLLSLRTANAIQTNKISRSSKIENVVAGVLDMLCVPYRRQVVHRANDGTFAFVFDFMIADDVAIEVNGTFWHADPRFYPDGAVHKIQQHNLQKWNRKIESAKNNGITIIEIWEYDIKQNAHSAVVSALSAHLH